MSKAAALWEEWADEDLLAPSLAVASSGSASTWTWPDTDLGVKVEIAWGADPSADPATWTFVDYTSRLLQDQPIPGRRGRGDGQATLQSGTYSFLLQNLDGELTPTRRSSTLWPNVRRTTPVRITLTNVGPNPPYIRFTGFISSITPKIVVGVGGLNLSTVLIQASGVTRRLSQGAATKSAMRRSLGGYHPIAYWPLEAEGGDATLFGSGISGGLAGIVGSGTTPGLVDGPDGAQGAVEIVAALGNSSASFNLNPDVTGGVLALPVGTYTSTGTILVTAYVRQDPDDLPSPGTGGATGAFVVRCTGGTVGYVQVHWQGRGSLSPTVAVGTYDQSGVAITGIGGNATNIIDGEWHEIQLLLVQSGSNVLISVWLDGTAIYASSDIGVATFSTIDRVYNFGGLNTDVSGNLLTGTDAAAIFSLCHVAVYTSSVGRFYDALDGYLGEQAHVRIARTALEEGVLAAVRADPDSKTMGPQPVATIMDVWKECEATDRGILFETRDSFGIGYLAHTARYNRTPTMTVDLATYRTGDTSDNVLAPVYDDQRLRNRWTISRPNGGSSTIGDASSIADEGLYDDSATANVETDPQTAHVAAWRVHEGIPDELRYPAPPVDLAANPLDLLPAWLVIDFGDLIRSVNPPSEHAVSEILQTLQGYSETLMPRSWSVTTSVSAASPWQYLHVVASQDGNRGRVDSDASTLSTGAASGDLTLTVAVGGTPTLWRTGACNFDIEVGPERMTVTNISGGSSPQTFTVVRSVNGIVNAPAAGTVVRLWNPGVYGL